MKTLTTLLVLTIFAFIASNSIAADRRGVVKRQQLQQECICPDTQEVYYDNEEDVETEWVVEWTTEEKVDMLMRRMGRSEALTQALIQWLENELGRDISEDIEGVLKR